MSLTALHDFELALTDPCLAMTRRGLRVDNVERMRMIAALEVELEPLRRELNDLITPRITDATPRRHLFQETWVCKVCRGGSKKRLTCGACNAVGKRVDLVFNPESGDQVAIALYTLLKLPKRTKDGRTTTDEDALKSLLALDKSGVVRRLLTTRKHGSMREILARLEPDDAGRIHTWYNVAGTETGRFSSSETWLERSTNLQNLPLKQAARSPLYDVRRVIVPDFGEAFCYADLSQAEARVVAALSGDKGLLERWQDATFDIHIWTAAHIFGKRDDDVTDEERHLGKVARHALNYGMGWATFLSNVNADADVTGVSISAADAKRIVSAYHRLHPSLEGWWRKVSSALDARGSLATVFGRTRTFFGRRSTDHYLDATHKEAIAFEPQSTVADLLNRGLLRAWRTLDRDGPSADALGAQLLAQVHDAVLVGVAEGRVADAATRLEACLEEEIKVNGVYLTIPCDVKVGYASWAQLQPLEAAREAA